MTRPRYPEYTMRAPLPDTLEICDRCKRNVVVYLGAGDASLYAPSPGREVPWCYTCNNDQPGVRYVRAQEA